LTHASATLETLRRVAAALGKGLVLALSDDTQARAS
jgi:hypothetical protein